METGPALYLSQARPGKSAIAATSHACHAIVRRIRRQQPPIFIVTASSQNPPPPTATSVAVQVRGLNASYGSRQILSDIDFEVLDGEIFVIMGASGAGKTTLLRHLLGLSKPRSGAVSIMGKPLFPASRKQVFAARQQIGVAFQHGALINSMSVIDNIELPLHQHTNLDPATIRIMSRLKLELMDLGHAEELMPAQLSGGMLKRAGLARAVVMDPKMLFFDEPSAGLDPITAAELDNDILRLRNAMRMTIVVVTHALESALKIADRLLIINDGRICALGTVEEVSNSADPYVQSLLQRRTTNTERNGEDYLNRLTADLDGMGATD